MDNLITLDFETAGIEPGCNPVVASPKPVGVAIWVPGSQPEYLSWGHPEGNNTTLDFAKRVLQGFAFSHSRLLFHNAAFDVSVMRDHMGIDINRWDKVHDTMFHLFLADPYSSTLSLKPSADRYLGMAADEQSTLNRWIIENVPEANLKNVGGFISRAPVSYVAPYAIGDVVRTRRLFDLLHKQNVDNGMEEAYDRERRGLPIFMDATRRGIRLDRETLGRDLQSYESAELAVSARIAGILGDDCFDSDDLYADALERVGAVTEWVRTPKSGKRSVSKDNLKVVRPDLKVLIEYKNLLDTCLQTFMRPWMKMSERDGKLHPNWNQVRQSREDRTAGAKTGRLCVHGDTLLDTDTGTFKIKNVPVGAKVRTHRNRWRTITARIYKGVEEMYRYTFDNGGSIVCTAAHRILTEGGWKHAQDIRVGDTVCGRLLSQRSWSADLRSGFSEVRVRQQGQSGNASHDAEGRLSGTQKDSVFQVQDGGKESIIRKARGTVTEVGGRLRGWQRVLNSIVEETQSFCAPSSFYGEVGLGTHTQGIRGSSYRPQSEEQRPRQFVFADIEGTRSFAQTAVISVDSVGASEVWDITVEEDHSYVSQGVYHHNSSDSPNFQNVPTEFTYKDGTPVQAPEGLPPLPTLRKYLLPNEGHAWVKRDFSSQEVRILAHFEDGELCEGYRANPKFDPHETARQRINEQIGKLYARKTIKTLSFAILYGAGGPGIAQQLGCTVAEAQAVKAAYLDAMPGIRQLIMDVQRRGKKGESIRTWGGRRYVAETARLVEGKFRDYAYKLTNYLIQGSAADQIKQAINDWFYERSLDASFLAAVHDEINISCPANEVDEHMPVLREAMDRNRLDLPMLSDGEVGKNWGSMKKYKDHEKLKQTA